MLYTLDSNAVSAPINNNRVVATRWKEVRGEGHEVKLNALSYFEVRRGLALPHLSRKFAVFRALVRLHDILLDLEALDAAADLYADLRRKGTPLEDADLLVAGIALEDDATLVTRNPRHFKRIGGLRLESWEA